MKSLPVLLVEVNSVNGEADRSRMLLQGACLVRLGNSLVTPESRFILKAIYIDENYRAIEHTMYQPENHPTLDQVIVPLIPE